VTAWPESVIATHSGLRGRPGAGLTSGVVRRAVRGLLTLIVEEDLPSSLGIARDGRAQGAEITAEAIACPVEAGAGSSTEPVVRITPEARTPRAPDAPNTQVRAALYTGARRR
jgi:phosphomannomutase